MAYDNLRACREMTSNTRSDSQASPFPAPEQPRASLEPVYLAAHYIVELPEGPVTLRPETPAPAFATRLNNEGCTSATLLTAFNPGSRPLSDHANTERAEQLERRVAQSGLRAWPTTHRDPEGQWPDEHGLCILDLPAEQLDAWLTEFAQNAAVVVHPPAPPRLAWHPHLRHD